MYHILKPSNNGIYDHPLRPPAKHLLSTPSVWLPSLCAQPHPPAINNFVDARCWWSQLNLSKKEGAF